jgi:hypothetical protein
VLVSVRRLAVFACLQLSCYVDTGVGTGFACDSSHACIAGHFCVDNVCVAQLPQSGGGGGSAMGGGAMGGGAMGGGAMGGGGTMDGGTGGGADCAQTCANGCCMLGVCRTVHDSPASDRCSSSGGGSICTVCSAVGSDSCPVTSLVCSCGNGPQCLSGVCSNSHCYDAGTSACGSCPGCCNGTQCLSGNSLTACGRMGQTCMSCGDACVYGVCMNN